MRSVYFSMILGTMMLVAPTGSLADTLDNFEDGVIDFSKWDVGGGARGWRSTDPLGTGPWSYSINEVGTGDGYLSARVWGPPTGNTYGAEAWVKTDYNFNDGKSHLIDFTWDATVGDSHYNHYMVQVTDGYIPPQADFHWTETRPPNPPVTQANLAGTADLLMSRNPDGTPHIGAFYPAGLPKSTWSVSIDPLGSAKLYDGHGSTASLLSTSTLNKADPWYLRFMVSDGTSAGFPAGDARLNLYDVAEREPEVFGLFTGVRDSGYGLGAILFDFRGDQMATDMMNAFVSAGSNFQKNDSSLMVGDARTDNHPTEAGMTSAIQTLSPKTGPGDAVVVYITGHGTDNPSEGPESESPTGYTPGNAGVALGFTYYSEWAHDTLGYDLTDIALTGMLQSLPATTQKWVMIDSCYSGGFWTSLSGLSNIGLLASAPADANAWAPGGYGFMTRVIEAGLTINPLSGYALADKDHDGLSFNDLCDWAETYDVSKWMGWVVQPIGGGDPTLFTPDMWNPVAFTSPDFAGGALLIPAGGPVPAPGAILLGTIGAGLVGWFRRRRTL